MVKLLDLFCGAGGAAMGYHQAGFDVTGVDNVEQPRYPFTFIKADALEYGATHGHAYDAIHASPPCQAYSGMSACRPGLAETYPELIDATRALLQNTGRPWVIENVAGSGLAEQPDLFGANGLLLCGAMFGAALYRHRLFESSQPLQAPGHPPHLTPASSAGHWVPGTVMSVAGNCHPIAIARHVMGINWMTRAELVESIPPTFTRYIGGQLLHAFVREVIAQEWHQRTIRQTAGIPDQHIDALTAAVVAQMGRRSTVDAPELERTP